MCPTVIGPVKLAAGWSPAVWPEAAREAPRMVGHPTVAAITSHDKNRRGQDALVLDDLDVSDMLPPMSVDASEAQERTLCVTLSGAE